VPRPWTGLESNYSRAERADWRCGNSAPVLEDLRSKTFCALATPCTAGDSSRLRLGLWLRGFSVGITTHNLQRLDLWAIHLPSTKQNGAAVKQRRFVVKVF